MYCSFCQQIYGCSEVFLKTFVGIFSFEEPISIIVSESGDSGFHFYNFLIVNSYGKRNCNWPHCAQSSIIGPNHLNFLWWNCSVLIVCMFLYCSVSFLLSALLPWNKVLLFLLFRPTEPAQSVGPMHPRQQVVNQIKDLDEPKTKSCLFKAIIKCWPLLTIFPIIWEIRWSGERSDSLTLRLRVLCRDRQMDRRKEGWNS